MLQHSFLSWGEMAVGSTYKALGLLSGCTKCNTFSSACAIYCESGRSTSSSSKIGGGQLARSKFHKPTGSTTSYKTLLCQSGVLHILINPETRSLIERCIGAVEEEIVETRPAPEFIAGKGEKVSVRHTR